MAAAEQITNPFDFSIQTQSLQSEQLKNQESFIEKGKKLEKVRRKKKRTTTTTTRKRTRRKRKRIERKIRDWQGG